MPSAIKTLDAIYLGDFGDMSAGGTQGSDARADVTGNYGVFGSGAADIGTVQEVTLRGEEDFADPNQFDNDFQVARNSGSQGVAEGPDPEQQVTYVKQNVLVDFTTDTGSFTANMNIFQLADGSVYMMENPQESPASSFRFSNAVDGREVTGFTIPTLGSTDNGFTAMETSWAASSFPVCFVAGTMIMTDTGEVPVETLRQGDLVMTMDHGLQPVRWIGRQELSCASQVAADKLHPVRIKTDALGCGLPESDLLVSQQHRVLVRSRIAQRMFGKTEVLVAAKHLVPLEGVDILRDVDAVTYVHFLCDRHEVVFANGAPSETLFAGPQAMKSVSPSARAEILRLFPELLDIDYKALSAREFVQGRQGRKLVFRHMKNCKALLKLH